MFKHFSKNHLEIHQTDHELYLLEHKPFTKTTYTIPETFGRVHGLSMVCPWFVHGLSMVCPWFWGRHAINLYQNHILYI